MTEGKKLVESLLGFSRNDYKTQELDKIYYWFQCSTIPELYIINLVNSLEDAELFNSLKDDSKESLELQIIRDLAYFIDSKNWEASGRGTFETYGYSRNMADCVDKLHEKYKIKYEIPTKKNLKDEIKRLVSKILSKKQNGRK